MSMGTKESTPHGARGVVCGWGMRGEWSKLMSRPLYHVSMPTTLMPPSKKLYLPPRLGKLFPGDQPPEGS